MLARAFYVVRLPQQYGRQKLQCAPRFVNKKRLCKLYKKKVSVNCCWRKREEGKGEGSIGGREERRGRGGRVKRGRKEGRKKE